MKIITSGNGDRVLIKDNNEEVYVNDGDTIQYTGIYYKTINDIVETVEIETTFIGLVLMEKFRHSDGIIGIYVKPLYIWNKMRDRWNKIVNYKPPENKYFVYPHLLLVSPSFELRGLKNSLHTCENILLDDFPVISECIDLGM
jgi:hypothetical protein